MRTQRGAGARRFLLVIVAAGAGLLVGLLTHTVHRGAPSGYHYGALTLLAIGLYGATFGIHREELTAGVRTIVAAVTVGVVVKAAIIGALIAVALGDPRYVILGVVVAQIDPLSVAALTSSSRMTGRAKAILSAWASFDDPITVLLTLYTASVVAGVSPDALGMGSGLAAYLADLGVNVGLAVAALAAWQVLGRRPLPAALAVVPLLAVGVLLNAMLAVALIGLFWRPRSARFEAMVGRCVSVAFVSATVLLGVMLADGSGFADIGAGVLLGSACFGAQVIVGWLLTRRLPIGDRVGIALGQQNGITAIILALLLRPDFPRAVAVVGPAIVVVNLIHMLTNRIWERRLEGLPQRPDRRVHPRPYVPDVGIKVGTVHRWVGEPSR
jgi:hypothetical protein